MNKLFKKFVELNPNMDILDPKYITLKKVQEYIKLDLKHIKELIYREELFNNLIRNNDLYQSLKNANKEAKLKEQYIMVEAATRFFIKLLRAELWKGANNE